MLRCWNLTIFVKMNEELYQFRFIEYVCLSSGFSLNDYYMNECIINFHWIKYLFLKKGAEVSSISVK